MGANQCCSQFQEHNLYNKLEYQFGEDQFQTNIGHPDHLETSNQSVNMFLKDCQQRLKKSQKLYKDPSLKSQSLMLKSSNQQHQFKCSFYRPYHFLRDTPKDKSYKIFSHEESGSSKIIIKNDALQYFGVFLCFLADNSHLVKDIILTKQNTYGIQVVYMYIDSVRIPIYIDDYILCQRQRPVFSQPIEDIYMWPCILEKAWLKLKGYGSKTISITSPTEVFQHFLLCPSENYNLSVIKEDGIQSIRKKIQTLTKSYGCIVTSKKQPPYKIGLSGIKHYYLKTIFQYQGKIYYYLRNPCGLFDFRGLYRTLSQQLQKKIKLQTGQTFIAEGNFILEEDQFLQQIQQLLIIHSNKNSNVISDQFVQLSDNQELYAQIKLQRSQQVSISFLQVQRKEGIQYQQVTYQILYQEEGNFKIISGYSNQQGCFGLRSTNMLQNVYQKLEKGSYLIRIKKKSQIPSKKKVIKDKLLLLHLNSYKLIPHQMKFVYFQCNLDKEKFYSFLKQNGVASIGKISSESRYKGQIIQYVSVWFGDLAYIYIRKINKQNSRVNLQVNFPQRINLQCLNYDLKNQFTTIHLNDDDLVIIFEKINLIQQTSLGKYFIETF